MMKILLLSTLLFATAGGPCTKSELQTAATVTNTLAPIACTLTAVAVSRSSPSTGTEVGNLCPDIVPVVQNILNDLEAAAPAGDVVHAPATVILVKDKQEKGTLHGDIAMRAKTKLNAAGITIVDPSTGKAL